MATITAVELRQSVAEELKVYSPEQELSADVAARIDTSIAHTRAWLKEKRLCWWGEDAVPQSVVIPVTWIVAAFACTKFGKAGQGYEDGLSRGRAELASLRPSADATTVPVDYF